MIDSHSHIDTEIFSEDRLELLRRAKEAGVDKIVIPAIAPEAFENQIEFANSSVMLYFGLGVHPHDAPKFSDEVEDLILAKAKTEKKLVAIGEIGLDYYYDFCPKDLQKEVFRKQLKLAKKLNLPVIVHNRDSDDDLLQIIEEEQDGTLRGVLHCFSGNLTFLEKTLNLNFLVSFTGNVTFKNSNFAETVKKVPANKYMIETDAPYITPVPFRGKRNEPAFVRYTAEKIAEIRNITFEEVVEETTKTANNFFKFALILLCVFSVFNTNKLNAQDEQQTEEISEFKSTENPFKKTLGFGGIVGTNTKIVVKDITATSKQDLTFEGIGTFGFNVNSDIIAEYLLLDYSYLYAKDSKIVEYAKSGNDFNMLPTIYNIHSATAKWIINPRNRVNFFGGTGVSFINQAINRSDVPSLISNNIAARFSLGFIANIKVESVGLFAITGEWRIDYQLGKNKDFYYDTKLQKQIPVDASSYFSIVNATLSWYPKF